MARNILFIASISLLSVTQATAQKSGNAKTVVVENKSVTTTRNSCTEPASNVTFYEFFKHLKAHNGFDSEKLREAEMAAGGSCFTSKQVGITLTGFTYEDTRIQFAKFAYKHVYDPAVYSSIKDGFKKSASWDEVEEYIKNK